MLQKGEQMKNSTSKKVPDGEISPSRPSPSQSPPPQAHPAANKPWSPPSASSNRWQTRTEGSQGTRTTQKRRASSGEKVSPAEQKPAPPPSYLASINIEHFPIHHPPSATSQSPRNSQHNYNNNVANKQPPIHTAAKFGEIPAKSGDTLGKTGENPGKTGENPGKIGANPGKIGENIGKTGENPGKTGENTGKTSENLGKTGEHPGKTGEIPGKTGETHGKPGETHGKPGETTNKPVPSAKQRVHPKTNSYNYVYVHASVKEEEHQMGSSPQKPLTIHSDSLAVKKNPDPRTAHHLSLPIIEFPTQHIPQITLPAHPSRHLADLKTLADFSKYLLPPPDVTDLEKSSPSGSDSGSWSAMPVPAQLRHVTVLRDETPDENETLPDLLLLQGVVHSAPEGQRGGQQPVENPQYGVPLGGIGSGNHDFSEKPSPQPQGQSPISSSVEMTHARGQSHPHLPPSASPSPPPFPEPDGTKQRLKSRPPSGANHKSENNGNPSGFMANNHHNTHHKRPRRTLSSNNGHHGTVKTNSTVPKKPTVPSHNVFLPNKKRSRSGSSKSNPTVGPSLNRKNPEVASDRVKPYGSDFLLQLDTFLMEDKDLLQNRPSTTPSMSAFVMRGPSISSSPPPAPSVGLNVMQYQNLQQVLRGALVTSLTLKNVILMQKQNVKQLIRNKDTPTYDLPHLLNLIIAQSYFGLTITDYWLLEFFLRFCTTPNLSQFTFHGMQSTTTSAILPANFLKTHEQREEAQEKSLSCAPATSIVPLFLTKNRSIRELSLGGAGFKMDGQFWGLVTCTTPSPDGSKSPSVQVHPTHLRVDVNSPGVERLLNKIKSLESLILTGFVSPEADQEVFKTINTCIQRNGRSLKVVKIIPHIFSLCTTTADAVNNNHHGNTSHSRLHMYYLDCEVFSGCRHLQYLLINVVCVVGNRRHHCKLSCGKIFNLQTLALCGGFLRKLELYNEEFRSEELAVFTNVVRQLRELQSLTLSGSNGYRRRYEVNLTFIKALCALPNFREGDFFGAKLADARGTQLLFNKLEEDEAVATSEGKSSNGPWHHFVQPPDAIHIYRRGVL